MSLTLMYITNNPKVAIIAQEAGVDRIWVDMEFIGKENRQRNMSTVKSCHTIGDIQRIRQVVTTSELMVRINPVHEKTNERLGTEEEIEQTIHAGADVIMLPYFKTVGEVQRFIRAVDGRKTTMILVETNEAVEKLDEILNVPGIDEVHIGLNDLHLCRNQKFMFELLCDGTVRQICEKVKKKGIKYGFGGIARIGQGMLPAEFIITEHYALGSTAAILSRSFCAANTIADPVEIEQLFIEGIKNIRIKEAEAAQYTQQQYAKNREDIKRRVNAIIHM